MLPMNPLKPASSLSFDYVEEWVMVAINSQFYNIDFLFMNSILLVIEFTTKGLWVI